MILSFVKPQNFEEIAAVDPKGRGKSMLLRKGVEREEESLCNKKRGEVQASSRVHRDRYLVD